MRPDAEALASAAGAVVVILENGTRLVFPAGDAAEGIAGAVGQFAEDPSFQTAGVAVLLIFIEIQPAHSSAATSKLAKAARQSNAMKIVLKVAGSVESKFGSYTIKFKSGKMYHGKGPVKRAFESAKRLAREFTDEAEAIEWSEAASEKEAYIQEHERLKKDGGPNNPDNYNKINSPGKKLSEDSCK
jgi:hypothetical protein